MIISARSRLASCRCSTNRLPSKAISTTRARGGSASSISPRSIGDAAIAVTSAAGDDGVSFPAIRLKTVTTSTITPTMIMSPITTDAIFVGKSQDGSDGERSRFSEASCSPSVSDMIIDPKELRTSVAAPSEDPFDPDEDTADDSPILWRIEAGPEILSVAPPDRVDRWLATAVSSGLGVGADPAVALPPLSRSRLKSLILDGQITVDGATISDPSTPVKPGSVFELSVPPPEAAEPVAQDIPLSVVFEDAHLIVVDKPAGMTVHPAPGSPDRTLVNALLFHCGDSLSGIGGVKRPGIVHRIDKDTSGLLVVAKSDAAHHGLAELFAEHDIERTYRALSWGVLLPSVGHIETDIGRHPSDRRRMAVRPEGRGKHAITHYKVLEPFGESACLVECKLETGRTHQIRVHLAHLGHPLIGDQVYARGRTGKVASLEDQTRMALAEFPRQALHAASLGFVHPITEEELFFERPSPADFENVIRMLRSDTRAPLKLDR